MIRAALAFVALLISAPVGAATLTFSSDRVEVVAVTTAQQIEVFIDDWGGNAPLAGLDVRLQSTRGSAALQETTPGTYVTPLLEQFAGQAVRLQIGGSGWTETFGGDLPAVPRTR